MHAVISGIQQNTALSQVPQVSPSQNLLKFSENQALFKVLFSVFVFGDVTSTLQGFLQAGITSAQQQPQYCHSNVI